MVVFLSIKFRILFFFFSSRRRHTRSDRDWSSDVCSSDLDGAEIQYLLRALGRYVRAPPENRDIVHSFSGVRPLYDDSSEDPSAVTLDYVFEIDGRPEIPPVLSIFGGKITTYRKLAEHALQRLRPWFPRLSPPWTAGARLPGGDIS